MSSIINTSQFIWGTANKTKGMHAKPVNEVFKDQTVFQHFKMKTLEGDEPVRGEAFMCIGISGEAWQQDLSKITAKYERASDIVNGWMYFTPKQGVPVEFVKVLPYMVEKDGFAYIQGLWGAHVDGVGTNLQLCREGDVIARNPNDTNDQWVVQRKIWDNSYEEVK